MCCVWFKEIRIRQDGDKSEVLVLVDVLFNARRMLAGFSAVNHFFAEPTVAGIVKWYRSSLLVRMLFIPLFRHSVFRGIQLPYVYTYIHHY